MKKIILALSLLLGALSIYAQKAVVEGTITDKKTGESLIGVNVVVGQNGTTSDIDGNYRIELDAGSVKLKYSYIGYEAINKSLELKAGNTVTLNITLQETAQELGVMVVSGSMFEKKLEEESVSIDVIQADLIQNVNTRTIDEALIKVPGFYMLDNQANMRGGTGFSYGAGSRIMLVIDEQPLLSADRSDIKWNLIPVENIEQVEVIKGASSVLYGASALNGVVHIRTGFPGPEPETSISMYQGFYDNPKRDITKWWDHNPIFAGAFFSHKQRFGDFDLVVGGHISTDNTHLRGEFREHARLNFKTRYRPPKHKGRLSFGLNGNGMYFNEGQYFLWNNYTDGTLQPLGTSDDVNQYLWFFLDPYITYFDKKDNKHSIKSRYYNVTSWFSENNQADAHILTTEYQFQKTFEREYILTAGVNGSFFQIDDNDLLDHTGYLGGLFAQAEKQFNRLNLSLGIRWEFFDLDTLTGSAIPVVRSGLNYRMGRSTYLRASFGQGYRFPSIGERFVDTDIGDVVRIFPNPDLKPEFGYNAEIGFKHTFKTRKTSGFFDLALFWTDYTDMTEFTFALYDEGTGFKSVNVGRARIAGYEASLGGEFKIGKIPFRYMGGYTFIYPADLTADSTLNKPGKYLSYFFKSFNSENEEVFPTLLRYRFRHIARFDIEADIWRFTIGGDIATYSVMERVDPVLLIAIPGLLEWWTEKTRGDVVLGMRMAYRINDKSKVSLIVKNLTNLEYSLRPAKVDPTRNFALQYRIEF